MSDDILDKIKMVVNKATQNTETSPGEPDENPLGGLLEQEALEDEEYVCYRVRRRPGESAGLELWFQDNSVQVHSYAYFRAALLDRKRETLRLVFSGAKVQLHRRGLVHLVGLLNERKLTGLIEQHADLDNGTEAIFVYKMVADVADAEA